MAGTPHRISGSRLLEGFDHVVNNLRQELAKIEGKTKRGLLRCGFLIQAESQEECPKDLGNLSASAYTTSEDTADGFIVETGYGTDYAIFQHEFIEFKHKPGQKAKFLEDPLKRNVNNILNIVAAEARVS